MNNIFSLIISNNIRSLFYLNEFKKLKKSPPTTIYINNNTQNRILKKKVKQILRNKIFTNIKKFNSNNFNETIIKYVLKLKEKNYIISLPHGEIIKNNKLLSTKNLIHFHPGKLPFFRGATSIYYNLLKTREIWCSAIIMSSRLDGGKILLQKKFKFPQNKKDIDYKFDNKIRADLLNYFLLNSKKIRPKSQKKIKQLHYYLAHPIIRKLSFLKM